LSLRSIFRTAFWACECLTILFTHSCTIGKAKSPNPFRERRRCYRCPLQFDLAGAKYRRASIRSLLVKPRRQAGAGAD
jgi:hypothetical protein